VLVALSVIFTGDDYLILLPECLPYLSELLEDSNKNVVAASTEVRTVFLHACVAYIRLGRL
jgi:hypothetical protein